MSRRAACPRALLATAALALGACGPADPPTAPTPAQVPRAPVASAEVPTPPPGDAPLPRTAASLPEELERRIDALMEQCVADREMPGAVVGVVRRGQLVFRKAYGLRAVQPTKAPMTTDAVFDLASLTKPIVTATSILLLAEQGKLRLSDPASKYVREFAQKDKGRITLEQLMLHTSGLAAGNPLSDYQGGRERALAKLHALPLLNEPGAKVVYSDLGYLVLGEVVEQVSGTSLDEFARQSLFEPLGMRDTTFRPSGALLARTAPTEQRDGRWLAGEVHDPRAHLLGGVVGHAGLFSTATDLSRFARMLLGGGELEGRRVLSADTVKAMTRLRQVPGGARALAWEMPLVGGVSHTGFTGTSMWLDPARAAAVVLLSNRLHPDGKGDATRMRREVVRLVVDAEKAMEKKAEVVPGVDVLAEAKFASLAGKRVALLTHAAGRSRSGKSTLELLAAANDSRLVALFAPEHGLGSDEDRAIADGRDPTTGLPVHSLYGKRRRPTREQLAGVDVLVVDLQDVGARFYTYLTTLGYALEAAAGVGVRVMVLDRPNPIGGTVEGPVLDADRESFTAYHRIPVRHGMTLGELARMVVAERKIKVDLEIVPVRGWHRGERFEKTGLSWVDPSPNLKNPSAALLYPGIGMLETTNVSVGRGTERPFELVGAPWIDAGRMVAALRAAGLPGVTFAETRFTPTSSKHAGVDCRGLAITVDDAARVEPVRTGLEIARQLRALHKAAWDARPYATLLGHRATFDSLLAGKTTEALVRGWQPGLADFMRRRAPHLLYPD